MKYCTYCYKILEDEYKAKRNDRGLMEEFISRHNITNYRCNKHWGMK